MRMDVQVVMAASVVECTHRSASRGGGAEDGLSLRTNLQPHIVRHPILLDQHPHEIEVRITRGGICDFDLLEAALDEGLKEDHLLRNGHWVGQGLVSIAEVGGQPYWGRTIDLAGPLAVRKVERGVGLVPDRRVRAVRAKGEGEYPRRKQS